MADLLGPVQSALLLVWTLVGILLAWRLTNSRGKVSWELAAGDELRKLAAERDQAREAAERLRREMESGGRG
jgi:hypothetical protein